MAQDKIKQLSSLWRLPHRSPRPCSSINWKNFGHLSILSLSLFTTQPAPPFADFRFRVNKNQLRSTPCAPHGTEATERVFLRLHELPPFLRPFPSTPLGSSGSEFVTQAALSMVWECAYQRQRLPQQLIHALYQRQNLLLYPPSLSLYHQPKDTIRARVKHWESTSNSHKLDTLPPPLLTQ